MYFLFRAHSTSLDKISVYQGLLRKQRKEWKLREIAMKETARLDYNAHRFDDVDKETHSNGGTIGLCIY